MRFNKLRPSPFRRQSSRLFDLPRLLHVEVLEERSLLAVVPVGFTDTVISNDQFNLTEIQVDQAGRVWLGRDDGRIGVIENDVLLTNDAYDLNARTVSEQGLQGLLLDRDFASNGYMYVFYTADDGTPNNKLSRLQVDVSTGNTIIPQSEVILLELPDLASVGDPLFHMGGSIQQRDDGTLLVQVGDHQASQLSQDFNAPFGKVLRVNLDGSPAGDNPYYDASDGITWTDYIWSAGLRNPFSGDIDPETGRYFISDVGGSQFEEVNEATLPGLNFGWPTVEGPSGDLSFTNPFYAYPHNGVDCAITAGTFYSGVLEQFPPQYQGQYFFSEYCAGEIRTVDPEDPSNTQVFATDISFPLKIAFAPDGSMYYLSFGDFTVNKIQYTVDAPPQVLGQPADALVSVGGEVSFEVSAAGTAPFSYQWQEDAGTGFVDILGATDSSLTLNDLSLSQSGYRYRAIVTNAFGSDTSNAATLTVTTDTPPTPSITLTGPTERYRAGDVINFSGFADDLEDGMLPASALTWSIDFHHNVHTHPFLEPTSGITSGSFTIPTTGETDADVWFRVYLTATDSAGFSTTIFAEIFPEVSDFAVESTLPEGEVLLDGQRLDSPVVKTGVVGLLRAADVPESDTYNAGTAFFAQWLDGVTSRSRTIATPEDDTAFVALYGITDELVEYTYVSDLTPIGTPINGWGPYEIDTNNGGVELGDGGPINLDGMVYAKGLGVHAQSDITFPLGGLYDRFLADVGLPFPGDSRGNVIFEVYGDGVLLGSSGPITGDDPKQTLNVDVAGVNELRLVVDSNGSPDFDSALWADARLAQIIPTAPAVYVSDLTPIGTPINGWGPYEIDTNNGGQAAGDGGTIRIGDTTYDKGLGVHAQSDITFPLNGQYDRFLSDVGLQHPGDSRGNVIFEVYGDGVLLGSSGPVTIDTPSSFDLDVGGVNELRLVVDANGSADYDSSVWADTRVIRNPVSAITTFVSDLTPIGTPINGWGPYEIDTNNGGQAAGDGGTIRIGDTTYDKGLGVHAQSDITFSLDGQYTRFSSDVGLQHPGDSRGNVIFEVYGDGILLGSSGPVTIDTPSSFDLDVTGVDELRLVVDANGSADYDSSVWADTRVTTETGGGPVGDIIGAEVVVDGRTLRLLPYTSADANLDTRLTEADAQAVADGWGPQPVDASFEDWVRAGDLNLNGVTDELDWEILNAAWLAQYGTTLNMNDFGIGNSTGGGDPPPTDIFTPFDDPVPGLDSRESNGLGRGVSLSQLFEGISDFTVLANDGFLAKTGWTYSISSFSPSHRVIAASTRLPRDLALTSQAAVMSDAAIKDGDVLDDVLMLND